MPATLLVDKNGHEISRLMGPAEWDSPEAERLIEVALRQGEGGGRMLTVSCDTVATSRFFASRGQHSWNRWH